MKKIIGTQIFLSAILGVGLAVTAVFVINPMIDWGTRAGSYSGYRLLLTITLLCGIGILTVSVLNKIYKYGKSVDSKAISWIICLLVTSVVTVTGGYMLTMILNAVFKLSPMPMIW